MRYRLPQPVVLWVVRGDQTSLIFIFTSKLLRLIWNHIKKKRNKTQRKHQKEQLSNFQIHGGPAISSVWNTGFFLAVLLNGAWHFHYSRKLNWLIFLQGLYVCYFREVQQRGQLFQHLHKRNADIDVLSEEKRLQWLIGNLYFNKGI